MPISLDSDRIAVIAFRERFTNCASCRAAASRAVKVDGKLWATACHRHEATQIRKAKAFVATRPKESLPPGEHVNCQHDPNSTATDMLAAMICSPLPEGGADRA